MQAVMTIDDKLQLLIDISDLCDLTRMSQTSIYRKMKKTNKLYDPSFPLPVDLGLKTNYWRYEDVKNWIANRPAKLID